MAQKMFHVRGPAASRHSLSNITMVRVHPLTIHRRFINSSSWSRNLHLAKNRVRTQTLFTGNNNNNNNKFTGPI